MLWRYFLNARQDHIHRDIKQLFTGAKASVLQEQSVKTAQEKFQRRLCGRSEDPDTIVTESIVRALERAQRFHCELDATAAYFERIGAHEKLLDTAKATRTKYDKFLTEIVSQKNGMLDKYLRSMHGTSSSELLEKIRGKTGGGGGGFRGRGFNISTLVAVMREISKKRAGTEENKLLNKLCLETCLAVLEQGWGG